MNNTLILFCTRFFLVVFCVVNGLVTVCGDVVVRGKITQNNLNGIKDEYVFVSQVGTNGYSMQMYEKDNKGRTNMLADIFCDRTDTIVVNMRPIGKTLENREHNIEENQPIYASTLNSTGFPFTAHSAIQLVWLATYANQKTVTDLIQKYPPGFIFSDVLFSKSANWYEFSLKDISFYNDTGMLCRFSQYPPETVFTTAEELLRQGVPQNVIEALPHSPYDHDKLIVQSGDKNASFPLYVYESSDFTEDSSLPKTAVLRFYSPPQPPDGVQLLFHQATLSIEDIATTTNCISPPIIDSPLLTVKDYRFNGIKSKPIDYGITNKKWPLFGTPTYQEMKIRALDRNKIPPRKVSPLATLIVVIFAFLPLLFLKLKRKK